MKMVITIRQVIAKKLFRQVIAKKVVQLTWALSR